RSFDGEGAKYSVALNHIVSLAVDTRTVAMRGATQWFIVHRDNYAFARAQNRRSHKSLVVRDERLLVRELRLILRFGTTHNLRRRAAPASRPRPPKGNRFARQRTRPIQLVPIGMSAARSITREPKSAGGLRSLVGESTRELPKRAIEEEVEWQLRLALEHS